MGIGSIGIGSIGIGSIGIFISMPSLLSMGGSIISLPLFIMDMGG